MQKLERQGNSSTPHAKKHTPKVIKLLTATAAGALLNACKPELPVSPTVQSTNTNSININGTKITTVSKDSNNKIDVRSDESGTTVMQNGKVIFDDHVPTATFGPAPLTPLETLDKKTPSLKDSEFHESITSEYVKAVPVPKKESFTFTLKIDPEEIIQPGDKTLTRMNMFLVSNTTNKVLSEGKVVYLPENATSLSFPLKYADLEGMLKSNAHIMLRIAILNERSGDFEEQQLLLATLDKKRRILLQNPSTPLEFTPGLVYAGMPVHELQKPGVITE